MSVSGAATPTASTPPRGLVILGHPVAQSLSPVFQGAALAHRGLPVTYTRRDTPPEQLDDALAACAQQHLGGNVTAPLKELVATRATRLTDVAARAGAVNTFWFEQGALVGHNTDVDGITATIEALLPRGPVGKVVLVGAGGAAAAVLTALRQRSVERLTLLARTPARAAALLARVDMRGAVRTMAEGSAEPLDGECAALLREATLVINCSTIGMHDDAQPVDIAHLGEATAVFDLVYRPQSTAWVRAAKARGLRAEDGLRMLVEQGAAAFRCWFGAEAPIDVMWAALGAPVPAADAPRA